MYALLPPVVHALAAVALLRAVQPASPRTGPAQSPPLAHHITGVPLAEGARDRCGPASLAAVLEYHGEQVTADEIARDIYLPDYRGSLNLDLLLWARRRGFDASVAAGSDADLKQAIARDRPVICMVRRRGPLADRNHFVVVRGYDGQAGVWFVDAGAGKEESRSAAEFDRDWRDCRGWMLVIEGRQPSPTPESDHAVE